MKKILKFRTKIEAAVAIGIVSMLVIVGVGIGTRTITDSSDTVDTYIRNSKGNYWTATGANLALAITDMGDDGGTITVGSDITLTTEIRLIYNDLTIDFQNNQVTLSGDISFVNVTSGVTNSVIKNAKVVPSSTATKSMIVLYLSSTAAWADRLYGNLFENIYFVSSITDYNYTAIHLNIASGGSSSMVSNTFDKIWMWYPKYAIKLQCRDDNSYGNGNTFNDIFSYGYTVGILFDVTTPDGIKGYNQNQFNNIKLQTATRSTNGIKDISGQGNRFQDCLVWDWTTASVPNYEYNIISGATDTYISSNYITYASINDAGATTYIDSGNAGPFYDKSPYDYIIYKNATYTFLQSGTTGLITYKSTSSQAVFDYSMDASNLLNIFVKSGTYVIADGTKIAGAYLTGRTFVGEDKYNTILQCVGTGTYASGIFYIGESAATYNLTFRNLCFDGNAASGGARGLRISSDYSSYGIFIENCIFKGFSGDTWSAGVYLEYPTTDTHIQLCIKDCEFIGNDYGISLNGDADPSPIKFADISNNYFSNNGIAITLAYVQNSTISFNRASSGTSGILEASTCGYNTFLGNNFLACTTDYNIDTTTYKPTGQTNFTNLNFGTWT